MNIYEKVNKETEMKKLIKRGKNFLLSGKFSFPRFSATVTMKLSKTNLY